MANSDTIDYQGFVSSFNFYASFGKETIAFSRISNLSSTVEYDAIPEGGLNDRVHLVVKPHTQVGTATFEKAVHRNDLKGYDKLLPVGVKFDTVSIFVTDGVKPVKMYVLNECFITQKSVSELNALGSSLLMSTMEVAYSKMEVVPV